MREDNTRQDILIEQMNTRLDCDDTNNKQIPEDSKYFQWVCFRLKFRRNLHDRPNISDIRTKLLIALRCVYT